MKMARRVSLAGVLLLTFLLTACSAGGETGSAQEGPVFWDYETKEPITCFTVDDSGIIYVCSINGESQGISNQITWYDHAGNPIDSWLDEQACMSTSIGAIAAYQDKVYFYAQDNQNQSCIYELDPVTGNGNVFCELPDFTGIKRICMTEDHIFILGMNSSIPVVTNTNNLPNYDNAQLYVLDMHSKEITKQFGEAALAISDTPDGDIMLHSYDNEEGYVFKIIDGKSAEVLDITQKQIEGISSFAYDGKGLIFYSPNALRTSFPLMLSYSLMEESGIADMMPNTVPVNAGGIVYRNGFTYVWNGMSGTIQRLKNSVYIKEAQEIRVIASSIYGTSSFSAGYLTRVDEKSDEELALAVLSNDRDFDVFYMSSRQSIAQNLKENGVYYSLDEVPYVSEYINSCFPYIQRAATDKDGNIWMIPIDVSIPVLIYDEKKCKALDADFASANTLEELLSCIEKCTSSQEYDFRFNDASFIQSNMRGYLRKNTAFDTVDFRKLATNLREAYLLPEGKHNLGLDFLFGTGNISFSSQDDVYSQTYDSWMNSDDARACSISAFDGAANSAICTYICVNPASDNLDATLDYISDLCEYLLSLNNYGLFSDPDRYPDSEYAASLYEVYENGIIDFVAPEEIYMPNLEQYMSSKISLDEAIKESDRQMAIYLNE